MSIIKGFHKFIHGADYNPEQWQDCPEIIDEDFLLMDKAHCNTFSVGIFSWAEYETQEGIFDFSWLDDIMECCRKAGKKVFLATPSAARPAWLGRNYPETCRVNAAGHREPWGFRANHCWTSPVMREKLAVIIRKLAERYSNHPALAGWHIGNEYHAPCYCQLCRNEFAAFLKERYGTIANLNKAYWSGFWSHKFSDWSEVDPLDETLDLAEVDFLRFHSRQVTDFMKFEVSIVREYSHAPVTTNMMGYYEKLDYWRLAEACGFISDDCYPSWLKGNTENTAAEFSLYHDMHYSMKQKPFLILESCPAVPNYKQYCKMRRPNELEREMLLALAHGADGTMYFQWRKGRGGYEKFHGAVVGHDGTDRTLTFKAVADYGRRLDSISEVAGSVIEPEVAVIFDWESVWAQHAAKGFGVQGRNTSRSPVPETIFKHYRALWSCNVPLAVLESTCDFSPYKVLAAPMLFMLKNGVVRRLIEFVENGGILIMTFLSGYVDENALCFQGGYPGGEALRKLFEIWNEDIDFFEPETTQTLIMNDGTVFPVERCCEYLHAEGAEVHGVSSHEFYAGSPLLTRKRTGKGQSYYIGADTGDDFLKSLYGRILQEADVHPVLPGLPPAVKATMRQKGEIRYYFVQNMSDTQQDVQLPCPMDDIWNNRTHTDNLSLPPCGSAVLRKNGK